MGLDFIEQFQKGLDEAAVSKETFSIARALNRREVKHSIEKLTCIRPSALYRISVTDYVKGYFLGMKSEEPDFETSCRFAVGNAVQEQIQRSLFEGGFLQCPEPYYVEPVTYCERYGIIGNIDGLLKPKGLFPKNQNRTPETTHLEIKAVNSHFYKNTNYGEDISESYKWQAECYQHCEGLEETTFLYVNYDTFKMKAIRYKSNPAIRSAALERCDEIWHWIGLGELPEYVGITKEQWQESIQGVIVPRSPAELDYTLAKSSKSAAEELFLKTWNETCDIKLEREHRFHPERKWRFDFAHLGKKIAMEIDGYGRHNSMSGLTKDCEKLNAAQKLGWRIFRYTAQQVKKSPQWVVDDLLEVIRE